MAGAAIAGALHTADSARAWVALVYERELDRPRRFASLDEAATTSSLTIAVRQRCSPPLARGRELAVSLRDLHRPQRRLSDGRSGHEPARAHVRTMYSVCGVRSMCSVHGPGSGRCELSRGAWTTIATIATIATLATLAELADAGRTTHTVCRWSTRPIRCGLMLRRRAPSSRAEASEHRRIWALTVRRESFLLHRRRAQA